MVQHDAWLKRIQRARAEQRPGDILTLAVEAPTDALKAEAFLQAGALLGSLGIHAYAISCYEQALALDPANTDLRQQKQRLLNQSKKSARAPASLQWRPRQVFLFSGHMIDATGRKDPRFPPDKENVAAEAIAAKLDELGAGADDLGLCGGACGGDLLFAEACLVHGLKLELRIPFDEPTFLRKSVSFAPGNWTERFCRVKGDPKTRLFVMPDELGPAPNGGDPYARANLWQLYNALSRGPDKVGFICLWNRKGGDGVGGTEHMYKTVQNYSGRVYLLDTTKLW